MATSDANKSWTVMVYLAGDNDLDSAGVVDLDEMKQVGSGDQLNIVAQFDRAGKSSATKRYLLRKGTTLAKDVVATLGETNMGDPEVLQDFLAWGAKNYPAEHYLVVIWNHGAGWDDENIYRSVKRGLKRNVAYKKKPVGETVRGAAGAIPHRARPRDVEATVQACAVLDHHSTGCAEACHRLRRSGRGFPGQHRAQARADRGHEGASAARSMSWAWTHA